jgi:hypothetical protein
LGTEPEEHHQPAATVPNPATNFGHKKKKSRSGGAGRKKKLPTAAAETEEEEDDDDYPPGFPPSAAKQLHCTKSYMNSYQPYY